MKSAWHLIFKMFAVILTILKVIEDVWRFPAYILNPNQLFSVPVVFSTKGLINFASFFLTVSSSFSVVLIYCVELL